MAEVESLTVELLREIRAELREVNSKIDDLKIGQNSHTGILMALSGYIRDIDVRVEHLETAMGVAQ